MQTIKSRLLPLLSLTFAVLLLFDYWQVEAWQQQICGKPRCELVKNRDGQKWADLGCNGTYPLQCLPRALQLHQRIPSSCGEGSYIARDISCSFSGNPNVAAATFDYYCADTGNQVQKIGNGPNCCVTCVSGGGGGDRVPICGLNCQLLSFNQACPIGLFRTDTCCCPLSPIVIDISRYWDWATNSGNGYHFTDVADGVRFDLNGDGIKEQTTWPTATSENAWLVLDRNGNGVIDSGKELFGNFTDQVGPYGEQVPTGQGNGWLALAEYDRSRSGGNESGGIDSGDAWFPNLRLWIDRNHNGLSEPNELITLNSIGITGIELGYQETMWTDQYGNNFRFRSRFKWGDQNDPESFYIEWFRDAWDVFPMWTP